MPPHHVHKQHYIICAAVWFDDGNKYEHQPKNIETGLVVTGRRHHNCFLTAFALNEKTLQDLLQPEQTQVTQVTQVTQATQATKTVREWFEQLPEPARSRAIANTAEANLYEATTSLRSAICYFSWKWTREGHTYWKHVAETGKADENLSVYSDKPLTIFQWCGRLPEEVRQRVNSYIAVGAIPAYTSNTLGACLKHVLNFKDSIQGEQYWNNICQGIFTAVPDIKDRTKVVRTIDLSHMQLSKPANHRKDDELLLLTLL